MLSPETEVAPVSTNFGIGSGPEFTAQLVRRWLARLGVQTLYIEPGSPWENGYNESFTRQAEGRVP